MGSKDRGMSIETGITWFKFTHAEYIDSSSGNFKTFGYPDWFIALLYYILISYTSSLRLQMDPGSVVV